MAQVMQRVPQLARKASSVRLFNSARSSVTVLSSGFHGLHNQREENRGNKQEGRRYGTRPGQASRGFPTGLVAAAGVSAAVGACPEKKVYCQRLLYA